jgi:hypothetical protein
MLGAKAGDLDHLWPENLDHQKPELSACILIMCTNCNLLG